MTFEQLLAKALANNCNGLTVFRTSDHDVFQVNAKFGDGWRIRMATIGNLEATFREVLAVDDTEMEFLS